MKYKILPEWTKIQYLIFVWAVPRREYLIDYYTSLISLIPSDINILLVVKSKEIEVKAKKSLREILERRSIEFIIAPTVNDIWIRDWCGFTAKDSSGKTVLLKTIYNPKYLPKSESKPDNDAFYYLAKEVNIPVVDVPLILDGGNFIHDGKGTAIITERILSDNKKDKKNYNDQDIIDIATESLGLDRLIMVPEEPEDETGHIDGVARFISENEIIIGSYPEEYPDGKKYMDDIAKMISQTMGTSLKIYRVINDIPSDYKTEGILSAEGNYINYLRIGNSIVLPFYGSLYDDMALSVYNSIPNLTVIPIRNSTVLAQRGGVLNCISSFIYA